jgi:hypothetical protein
MATYYVSNTASNGYSIGVDTNAGTSKALAVLTFEKALLLATSGSDTIYLNDGTYTAPGSPGFWQLTASITVLPENSGMVTFRGDGIYAVRLFNLSQTTVKNIAFSNVIFDGVNITNSLFYCAQTTALGTLTFTGTTFKDFTHYALKNVSATGQIKVVATNIVMTGSSWARGGIYLPTLTAGGVDIDGLTVTQSGRSSSEGGIVCVQANAAGITASVKNANIVSNLHATASANVHYGILLQNVPNALIQDCYCEISGVGAGSAAADLFAISALTTGLQDSSYGKIINCSGKNATSAGKTARIGTDDDTAATNNQHNYGLISGGTYQGSVGSTTIHGPMLGHGTGGKIEGVTCDYVSIGALGLLKVMVVGSGILATPISIGNKATHCNSSFCYQKGSTGVVHANNTGITSADYAGTFEYARKDETASPIVQGANGIFANNLFTGDTAPTYTSVQGTPGDATDTTTGTLFYNSCYDTTLGVLTNKWRNGSATTYANAAAFTAALGSATYPCANIALNLDGDYKHAAGSAYAAIGYRSWLSTGQRPIGADSEPFPDYEISIGAFQSKYTSSHP